MAVRFGLPDTSVAGEVRILGDEVFAVASPLYLQRRGIEAERCDFEGQTLLTMESARSHWHDWPSWFEAVGRKMPGRVRELDFNSYAHLVNAALAGQGVCLGWSGLLDQFLESGALVRLGAEVTHSDRGYHIALREGLAARIDARAVYDWIMARAGVVEAE